MRVEIETRVTKKEFATDLYCSKNGTMHHKRVEGSYEGTKDAVELAAVVAGLERMIKPAEILVITRSDYVLAPFKQGWFEYWKKNGWLNRKGNLVRNYELWQRLAKLMELHDVKFKKGE